MMFCNVCFVRRCCVSCVSLVFLSVCKSFLLKSCIRFF